ncbi:uncharacterized protein YbjT (DUF2867 family) [Crossiella equi]|uniref:Uncharacterized protein YbjT (DUF2867 family) n=1 Tax=Crossiella equi TaxID=130796 RepID=A0ABS5ALI5_9PSEU|nr:NAD(P)H-binding protein [Crossiella equi]MBP2477252.1 uncharacterized protein YbjT (DUF2867 family) [Crossiella equi]
MGVVLVTGGSGTLGRAVVRALLRDGHEVRVTSRGERRAGTDPRIGWHAVDYATGAGLAEALAGVDAVVHAATGLSGKKDVALTDTVVKAARRAGSPHLVYISIVGVDRVPFPYYRGKLAAERVVSESGLPWTVLRTTQFHDLVLRVVGVLAKSPVVFVPKGVPVQPVEVTEVADRLAALAAAPPSGYAAELGGPETRPVADFLRVYLERTGRRCRIVLPFALPGKVFAAFRDGGHLSPEHAEGSVTFGDYLSANVPGRS